MANAPDTPATPAPTLWNSLVKPAVVLVLICAIVGFLLGSVDNLTLPTITAVSSDDPTKAEKPMDCA